MKSDIQKVHRRGSGPPALILAHQAVLARGRAMGGWPAGPTPDWGGRESVRGRASQLGPLVELPVQGAICMLVFYYIGYLML